MANKSVSRVVRTHKQPNGDEYVTIRNTRNDTGRNYTGVSKLYRNYLVNLFGNKLTPRKTYRVTYTISEKGEFLVNEGFCGPYLSREVDFQYPKGPCCFLDTPDFIGKRVNRKIKILGE